METKKSRFSKLGNYFTTIYEGISDNKIITIDYIIYKLYNFNERISGTPKKSGKEMGSLFIFGHFKNVQFSKCDY